MKRAVFFIVVILASSSVFADKYVNGYYRKDGTYVQGHTKSSPDQYRYNNRSSQSMGGTQRDEYSSPGATNRRNSGYGRYDNDNDGINNSLDRRPNSKRNCNSYSTYNC